MTCLLQVLVTLAVILNVKGEVDNWLVEFVISEIFNISLIISLVNLTHKIKKRNLILIINGTRRLKFSTNIVLSLGV